MKKSGEVVLSDCEGQEKEMDRYSRLADTIERLMKEERASGGGLSRIGQYGPWRTRLHEAGNNGIWVRIPKEKAGT